MAQLPCRSTGVHQHLQDLLDRTIQEAAPKGKERPGCRMLAPHLLERTPCASQGGLGRLLQPLGDGPVKGEASAFLASEWPYEIHNGLETHRSRDPLEGSQIRALGPGLVRGDGGLGGLGKLREPALCKMASLTEVPDRVHNDILMDIFALSERAVLRRAFPDLEAGGSGPAEGVEILSVDDSFVTTANLLLVNCEGHVRD